MPQRCNRISEVDGREGGGNGDVTASFLSNKPHDFGLGCEIVVSVSVEKPADAQPIKNKSYILH